MPFLSAGAIAAISLTTTAIGTGAAVFSQIQQGKAAEDAAEANARLAEQEAKNKQSVALENIRRQRARNRRFLSRQRALIAGRGIAMEGSALAILGRSAGVLDINIDDALREAQLSINQSHSEAQQARFGGDQARGASNLQAGATLLSGVASLGSSAFNFADQGAI